MQTVAAQPASGLLSPAAAISELRGGGLVIYFRHTSTVHAPGDEPDEVSMNCETQRKLSDKGRAEALEIGRALRSLGIPIGPVAASPSCRTRDTAALAFGYYQAEPDLGFVIGTNAEETRRRAERLRQMLGSAPERGANRVIVSHSANLYEAAAIFAKPEGAAYVFRPLGDGRFVAIARILPEEWSELAKKTGLLQMQVNIGLAK